jgi:hypothetical protein
MIRQIPLTQGQCAIVDEQDYERLSQHKWHARWNPYTRSYYAFRSATVHLPPDGKSVKRSIPMHREVLGLESEDRRQVDHHDHNTLNNTKENLRAASRSQNQHNARGHADGSSGYKGVHWHSARNSWVARIYVNGVEQHLGMFDSAEDAARAYDAAASKHHGEFAYLNLPNAA